MTIDNSLTHLAYRSCVDGIQDVLGENGKNSVLRFARLTDMIEEPVDYDPEARVPYEYVTKLFVGVRDLMGNSGYEVIMYRGGGFAVKNIVKHSRAAPKPHRHGFRPGREAQTGLPGIREKRRV